MGWFVGFNRTRKELIAELIKTEHLEHASRHTLRHCVRGNVLWSLVEIRFTNELECEPYRYIACDLMQKIDGYWGNKPLSEIDHPYYYSCPLSYLEAAPVQSDAWRRRVQTYHEALRARRMTKHRVTELQE